MAQNLPRTWLYLGERQYRYQWLSNFIQELKNQCVTWRDFKPACEEITWVLKKHKVDYPEKKSTDTWASYGKAVLNRLQELSGKEIKINTIKNDSIIGLRPQPGHDILLSKKGVYRWRLQ